MGGVNLAGCVDVDERRQGPGWTFCLGLADAAGAGLLQYIVEEGPHYRAESGSLAGDRRVIPACALFPGPDLVTFIVNPNGS